MPLPVLFLDEQESARHFSMWNNLKTKVQEIITLYGALALPALTPGMEFKRLFTDTAALIFDKVTGGALAIGGVPVDKEKAMEIVQKPAGYSTLINALDQLQKDVLAGRYAYDGSARCTFYYANVDQYFVLDGGNQVQLAPSLTASIDKLGKHYATTDKQIAMWQFVQAAVAKYYELGLDQHFKYMEGTNDNPIRHILAKAMTRIDYANEVPIGNRELTTVYG